MKTYRIPSASHYARSDMDNLALKVMTLEGITILNQTYLD